MNREEFYNYIMENYSVSGEFARLLSNVLIFVENNYPSDYDRQYNILSELLNGTIGLSDMELRKISM